MIRLYAVSIASAVVAAAVTLPSAAASIATFVAIDGRVIAEQLDGDTLTTQVGRSPATHGSGIPGSREIQLSGIRQIIVLVGANMEITAGPAPQRATLAIDNNLSDAIAFSTEGDTLTISAARSFVAKRPRIRVNVQTLQRLESRATDEIRVTGIAADSFALKLGGTGTTSVSGKTAALSIENSGSAFVDCSKVGASSVALTSRGSGSTYLPRSANSSVRIDGSGSVFIPGDVSGVSRAGNGSGNVIAVPAP